MVLEAQKTHKGQLPENNSQTNIEGSGFWSRAARSSERYFSAKSAGIVLIMASAFAGPQVARGINTEQATTEHKPVAAANIGSTVEYAKLQIENNSNNRIAAISNLTPEDYAVIAGISGQSDLLFQGDITPVNSQVRDYLKNKGVDSKLEDVQIGEGLGFTQSLKNALEAEVLESGENTSLVTAYSTQADSGTFFKDSGDYGNSKDDKKGGHYTPSPTASPKPTVTATWTPKPTPTKTATPTPTTTPEACISTDVKGRLEYTGNHMSNSPVIGHFQNIAKNKDCPDDVYVHIFGSDQTEVEGSGWLESQHHVASQKITVPEGAEDYKVNINVPNEDDCWYQVDATRNPNVLTPPRYNGVDMIDYVFVKDKDSCLPTPTTTPTPSPTPPPGGNPPGGNPPEEEVPPPPSTPPVPPVETPPPPGRPPEVPTPPSELLIGKFLDANRNGVYDPGEIGQSARFQVDGPFSADFEVTTDQLGNAKIPTIPGQYVVCELELPGYELTTAGISGRPQCQLIVLGNGESKGVLFGNAPKTPPNPPTPPVTGLSWGSSFEFRGVSSVTEILDKDRISSLEIRRGSGVVTGGNVDIAPFGLTRILSRGVMHDIETWNVSLNGDFSQQIGGGINPADSQDQVSIHNEIDTGSAPLGEILKATNLKKAEAGDQLVKVMADGTLVSQTIKFAGIADPTTFYSKDKNSTIITTCVEESDVDNSTRFVVYAEADQEVTPQEIKYSGASQEQERVSIADLKAEFKRIYAFGFPSLGTFKRGVEDTTMAAAMFELNRSRAESKKNKQNNEPWNSDDEEEFISNLNV